MNRLEEMLNDIFVKKLPGLPASSKETMAKFLPWVMIVLGGLGLMGWLYSLRYFFGVPGYMTGYMCSSVWMTISMILVPIIQGMAIYGGYLMLSRQKKGWRLTFYSLLIGLIFQLLNSSIFGALIDVAFAYLLFQIRDMYFA